MELQEKAAVSEQMADMAKYDPEFRFRQFAGITLKLAFIMTLILSIFHIYTAGFGVLQEWRHRAFHLSFVLPLVFFFYAIRKEHTETAKHFLYDLAYGLIGTSVFTVLFREIFRWNNGTTLLAGALFFVLIVYFKRREFLHRSWVPAVDFVINTLLAGGLVFGFFLACRHIDFRQIFRDPNFTLVFWSVLLFGIFASITLLFLGQWVRALVKLARRGGYRYDPDQVPYFDVFFALMASGVSVYIFIEFNTLVLRAGLPSEMDLIVGAFAFLLVLEGARRSIGAPLPLISFIVLVNCYLGPYFLDIPGLSFFAHRGYSVSRIIEHMYLGTEGIYGVPLGVVATFVFHFVLFGIFISKTGLGQLFMDIAMAIAGWSSGGPAKVAVISSGFLGSISGSSIANTVTTGAFTIPLMKKVGYRPQFAGAVEAASSTGGQLMPPIMGAAAFIMAEFLGIPYIKIAACAVVPALLYFFAVGTMVHLEARKRGLKGLPRNMLPRLTVILRERWLLLMPLFIIVFLLISGSSPFLAAFWGILYAVAAGQIHEKTRAFLVPLFLSVPSVLFRIDPLTQSPVFLLLWLGFAAAGYGLTFSRKERRSWLLGFVPMAALLLFLSRGLEPSLAAFWCILSLIAAGVSYRESRMRIPDILETLELGTKNALAIGAACACIGFIVGATTLTGLGLKFAAAVIQLAQILADMLMSADIMGLLSVDAVALFFTLVLTAAACFILGMGIPTTAQYIIASMIAAPALLQWGIHPLVSHMFVLFFAVLADVTPPVALAAYAASGISGANPFKTGFTAFGLASAGFCVPFIFVSAPIVLWLPHLLDPSAPFHLIDFLEVLATLVMGVIALGSTVIGYLGDKLSRLQRLLMGIAAAGLFVPEVYTDIFGFIVLLSVYLFQRRKRKMEERSNNASLREDMKTLPARNDRE
ncbi:MAG TPA: TRAP transporter permease [Syntrophales bacterium]|nr:TRAP transporter permease [Syntrophales bacterium]HQN79147.1 TRAP transporter permease [Syntrophales bacterium]HQQ28344.1 TRAP transporter permease [Syntrophales bacterium]